MITFYGLAATLSVVAAASIGFLLYAAVREMDRDRYNDE